MRKYLIFLFVMWGVLANSTFSQIPTEHMQLWLKSDTGLVLNSSKVIKWLDQSGNGNDAIESDTSRQPTLINNVLNGKAVLSFDGYDDRLGFTGSNHMNQISLFTILRIKPREPNLDGHWVLTFGPGGTYIPNEHIVIKLRNLGTDNNILIGTGDGVHAVSDDITPNVSKYNEWRNMNIIINYSLINTTLRWNSINANLKLHASNIFFSVPLGDSSATGGGIGSTDNFGVFGNISAKCDIAEVIVYDTVLTNADRKAVEDYLREKYNIGITDIEDYKNNIPQRFTLYQNFPNPFNPSTTFRFEVPKISNVKISLYDGLGKEIRLITNRVYSAGTHVITLNLDNLASGVYYYKMESENFREVKKLVLLK